MKCRIIAPSLFVALLALFAWRHRGDGQAVADLRELEQAADAENRPCNAYRDRWAKELPLSGGETTYGSRALALRALGLLETFPGWGKAAAAEADRFIDDAPALADNIHQLDLLRIRARSHGTCELLPFFNEARILIGDSDRFHFTASERKRLRDVLERYLLGEPRFRILMEGMLKISLLRAYVESLPDGDRAAARVLDDETNERWARLRQNWHDNRFTLFGLRANAFEARQTQELFERYYPLARKTFAGCAKPAQAASFRSSAPGCAGCSSFSSARRVTGSDIRKITASR